MNTQKGFLDNTVDDGFVVDGTEELNTEMCSYIQNDIEEMCSSMRDDTCGMCRKYSKETYLEMLCFRQFYKHFVFAVDGEGNRNKKMEKYFEVSAVVNVGCGDTKNSYF